MTHCEAVCRSTVRGAGGDCRIDRDVRRHFEVLSDTTLAGTPDPQVRVTRPTADPLRREGHFTLVVPVAGRRVLMGMLWVVLEGERAPTPPPELKHALIAEADLFTHLSWHDAFGFVTLEAMAAGLPVVTTPYVGASEVIRDGDSGLIVDPRDPAAVTAAIQRLLEPDHRQAIGRAAAEVGRQHPEEDNFRRVLDVLRTAARRGPRPG